MRGLPAKNGPLTSSIGSVATLHAVLKDEPDEAGRVGGWLASFDKLIQDPLGLQCLLVGYGGAGIQRVNGGAGIQRVNRGAGIQRVNRLLGMQGVNEVQ